MTPSPVTETRMPSPMVMVEVAGAILLGGVLLLAAAMKKDDDG